jgi:hypothetical protein
MPWKPLQFGIMSAVVVSNAIWHWTPNMLLAGLIGTGAAFVVTLVVVKLFDLAKTKRSIRALENLSLEEWYQPQRQTDQS